MKYRSGILVFITAIEALLLLPTTLAYAGGMLFSLLWIFSPDKGGVNLAFLLVGGLLIVPGYALFSLWWLVLKFRKLTLSQIPFFINAGLIAGVTIALVFVSFTRSPSTPHIMRFQRFYTFLASGGGPLIVFSTVVLMMWLQRKR